VCVPRKSRAPIPAFERPSRARRAIASLTSVSRHCDSQRRLARDPGDRARVQWDAVDMYRFTDDGKISQEWAADDMATFASQLGALLLPWRLGTSHATGVTDYGFPGFERRLVAARSPDARNSTRDPRTHGSVTSPLWLASREGG
jgi:hypothetical protein